MIRRGIGVQSFVAAGGAGTDADAQAFITAAAITDATQQSAINTLVVDLNTYGIWTKKKDSLKCTESISLQSSC